MSKIRKQATAADTSDIPYDDAVRQGRAIVSEIKTITARTEGLQLRLGELAANVQKKYGDRTLATYAKEIGVAPCTLGRYRDVYRAYPNICAPGRDSIPSYAVLRELAALPNREEIILKNPKITKREARDLAREQKGYAAKTNPASKDSHRWFKGLVTLAVNDASSLADLGLDKLSSKQRADLREVIDPTLLKPMRDVGRMWIATADQLGAILDENDDPIPDTPDTPINRAVAAEAMAPATL
jgi:hypothetical protein